MHPNGVLHCDCPDKLSFRADLASNGSLRSTAETPQKARGAAGEEEGEESMTGAGDGLQSWQQGDDDNRVLNPLRVSRDAPHQHASNGFHEHY